MHAFVNRDKLFHLLLYLKIIESLVSRHSVARASPSSAIYKSSKRIVNDLSTAVAFNF